MNTFEHKKIIYISLSVLAIVGFIFVEYMLIVSKNKQEEQAKQLILQEATSHYKNIKGMEIWHNRFGGVFVESEKKDDYTFDIFSLRPKNDENKAQGFAKKGLEFFENNIDKNTYYAFNDGFKFIGALRTEKKCIECHSDFKIGDVRGGVQLNIPTQNYNNAIETISKQYKTFQVLVFTFFILTTSLLFMTLRKIFQQKEEVEQLNDTLELKVIERTNELNKLYNKERYIKSLFETISDLNQSLIESYSISSILESSLEKLQHHPSYKLIIFAHFDGEIYHVRYKFGDIYDYCRVDDYTLDILESMPIGKTIVTSIKKHHWNVESINLEPPARTEKQLRESDYTISNIISFPLIDYEDESKFDVLTICTDRENGFNQEEISILDTFAQDIKMALSVFKQRQLNAHLQQEQITNYEETILAFVDMIEQRDAYTAGHTLRVARYSRLLAEELGIKNEQITKIEKAAILHDIGKIATPDTILLKPGKLRRLEYDLIKNHVLAGYKMLSKVKMYSELAEIMKYHHEHYDGSGYPFRLKGDEIPFEAHIMIVADAFDAMTTNRIYKGRLSIEEALKEINKYSGTQFHPKVVEAANKCLTSVTIDNTTQLPSTELEKQRFSYFFNDNLTTLYNQSYLQLYLNEKHEKMNAYIIRTKNFSEFNKVYSWEKGNEYLKLIAIELQDHFHKAKIFRFEGDDFLVLSQEEYNFSMDEINLSVIDPDGIIELEYKVHKLKSGLEINEFKKELFSI